MPTSHPTTTAPVFNSQNPATWLKPDDPLIGADGRDWSWCYAWHKDVVGFPGYKVGSDGSIWSCKRSPSSAALVHWKRMRLPTNQNGYLVVTLRRDGRGDTKFVQDLVLEAFVGPRPSGMVSCHFPDRTKSNNALWNLRWDTQQENLRDREIHGTMPRGTRNGSAVLNPGRAELIRSMYGTGRTPQSIADELGVGRSTVRRTLAGETWDNGSGSIIERRVAGPNRRRSAMPQCPPRQAWLSFMLDWRTKILPPDVEHMAKLRRAGYSLYQIADVYGVSAPRVCELIGKTPDPESE